MTRPGPKRTGEPVIAPRKERDVELDELEDESIDDSPTLDDFEALVEGDDAAPSDRRRDPLRH